MTIDHLCTHLFFSFLTYPLFNISQICKQNVMHTSLLHKKNIHKKNTNKLTNKTRIKQK